MSFTRREFGKTVAGAAAVLGSGALSSGCGSSDVSSREEAATLAQGVHFDLSAIAGDPDLSEPTLHVNGRDYPLTEHTAATLAAATLQTPSLGDYPAARVTHFAKKVRLSTTRGQRIHVTATHQTAGNVLLWVDYFIPADARVDAATAGGPLGLNTPDDDVLPDHPTDNFVDPYTTAKSILFHHPDLVALEKTQAAEIDDHMNRSADVKNLARSIQKQGPAYEQDKSPTGKDGWAVLVPIIDDDGNPVLDDDDHPTFDYVFSDTTTKFIQPAIDAILGRVKQDARLRDKKYAIRYEGDAPQNLKKPVPAQSFDLLNTLSRRDLFVSKKCPPSCGTTAVGAVSDTNGGGYHHNVWYSQPKQDSPTSRSFTINVLNMNFLFYGLYYQFLDGNNQPIEITASSTLVDAIKQVIGPVPVETKTIKLQTVISSPPTLFAIPLAPVPTALHIDLPPGASSVRIMLIGPGAYGLTDSISSLIWIGTSMTTVFQLAVPMYFLAQAVGIDEDATLKELFLKNPDLYIEVLKALLPFFAAAVDPTEERAIAIGGALAGLLLKVVQKVILIMLTKTPALAGWLAQKVGIATVTQSTPFVGWALRLLTIGGTLAQIAVTIAEFATNPWLIEDTVSFTQTVTVNIDPDPTGPGTYPPQARFVKVDLYAGEKPIEKILPINPAKQKKPFTVTFENVPTTGKPGYLEVSMGSETFVAGTSWDNATGDTRISFDNHLTGTGAITVALEIKQKEVPIDATSKYLHQRKLIRSGGRYDWDDTAPPPALVPKACGLTGLCEPNNLAIYVPAGMLGYSWRAGSASVTECRSGGAGQLYQFGTMGILPDPNPRRTFSGCGLQGPSLVTFVPPSMAGGTPTTLYLDAVNTSFNAPEYHLRPFNGVTAMGNGFSYGRFRLPLDRLAFVPGGLTSHVVGISQKYGKLAVLELPASPFQTDDFANNAVLASGDGDQESNDKLMHDPVALTVADNGAIVVLEGAPQRLHAFGLDGKPWRLFAGGTSATLELQPDDDITYLDVAIDPANLLWVLSFGGDGTDPARRWLDVYDGTNAKHIVRNSGINVANMTIDKFRTLYTLNYEPVAGSAIAEPSLSVWFVPTA